MAEGGLGLLAGKLFLKAAGASVDMKYTNNMPNVKTSFNHHLAYPDVNPTAYVHPYAEMKAPPSISVTVPMFRIAVWCMPLKP